MQEQPGRNAERAEQNRSRYGSRATPLGERRLFVVVNPKAANGSAGEDWGELRKLLFEILGPFDFRMTWAPGTATELAREALKDGYDIVASLGGDGTHNETVNGFFERGKAINPEAALAILPFGTGGDFRKSLLLENDIAVAARRILDTSPQPCDVGRMRFLSHHDEETERYFLNIASFGVSGLVDQKVNQTSKALGGTVSFLVGTLQALGEYTPQKVKMLIDDRIQTEVCIQNIAVANGKYFGGGMKVAPYASIEDGLFDLVIIRDLPWMEMLRNGVKLYEGTHLEAPGISHLQARKVYAEPANPGEPVLLDIDGEAPGKLPATFEILPGAIKIMGLRG